MLHKLSNQFAENISEELKLDEDKKEVIAYGTLAIMQISISVILIILFGLIFDVLLESLIISFTMSILRKYSGGVHASSPIICNIVGTTVGVGFAIILRFIYSSITIGFIISVGVLIFAVAFIIIYKLVPVDSPAKPIKTVRKKKRMKKASVFVTSFYLLIVLVLLIFYYQTLHNIMLLYVSCIYVGVTWQIFTLTKVGYNSLTRVDTFLNHILRRRRKLS